jgi:hypothetical protein
MDTLKFAATIYSSTCKNAAKWGRKKEPRTGPKIPLKMYKNVRDEIRELSSAVIDVLPLKQI